jgi:glycosyltransferase involved in cell wall biosynthesis
MEKSSQRNTGCLSGGRKMIIGIDGNEANVINRVGSNFYSFHILKNIYKYRKDNIKFKIYLKNNPLPDLPKETEWWQYQVLKPRALWTQWRLPLALIKEKNTFDLFFTPGHYAPKYCPVPLAISIMDLAFLRYPNQFKKKDLYTLKSWTKRSVKQADHIFTISEFSKKEIIHFYNYPEDKITITYPGLPNSKDLKLASTKILDKHQLKKGKYFIYVGTLQPRKNLNRLIKAFKKFTIHYPSSIRHLVIVGKKGWLYDDIFKKVNELKLKNKVIFTGYAPKSEKNLLLKKAFACILPSLYEGFGIPALEAMKFGCPVIAASSSSLPEVVGKAGLYINQPDSTDSIFKTILKMVKLGKRKRQRLIEKGYQQVNRFSWKRTAEKALKTLEKIGG